ncbi:hypothetical protein C0989_003379 [Termitomyces sp. Mn162]|nr:hypothetical protein C0989_003379 [Termitomyces sp. Mn162]
MPALLGQDTKGEGKAPSRPDFVPLRFSEESVTTGSSKSRKSQKDNGGKRKKLKAPTKKELEETARNRIRIAADQQVSIPRTEEATSKYTIQGLFAAYEVFALMCTFTDLSAFNNRIASKKSEIEADPIVDFSSERHTSPVIPHIALSSPALCQGDDAPLKLSPNSAQRSPLGAMRPLSSWDNDSNKDLPEVGALLEKEQEAQESLKRRRELLALKQRAMEMQVNAGFSDSDENDDLQIVQAPDMQMTIKEEETERRSGRKKRINEGRQRQLNLGGMGLKGKKVKEDPSKIDDFEVLRRAGMGQEHKGDPPITPALLAKIVHSKADAARQDIIRAKEEEWVQRGGRVKNRDDGTTSVQEVSKLYIEKGLNLPGGGTGKMENDNDDDDDVDDDDDDDDADNDTPELNAQLRGSASPFPTHGSEDENEDVDEEINIVDTTDLNPDDEESDTGLLLRTCRAVLKAIVDSDDEDIAPRPTFAPTFAPRLQDSPFIDHGISSIPSLTHRGSTSSLEDRTENEEDKENDTCRMFDRSEDKENKAVVRHVLPDDKVPSGTTKSTLLGLEGGLVRRPSLSPAHPEDDDNVTLNEAIDDDPFVSPSRPSRLPKSFDIRLKLTPPFATQPSTSPLNLTPFIGAKSKCFVSSQSPDEPSVGVGLVPLQPGFSDLFEFGTEKQNAAISPERLTGGLADKATPRDKLAKGDTLDLTQDITLQPAFEVSGTFLRKADQIFEKEQDFLTQTRPIVSTPEIYRRPSPTSAEVLSQSSTLRRPLRTISLLDEVEHNPPAPLSRLHRRVKTPTSPLSEGGYRSSPSPSLATKRSANAFDVLKRGSKAQAQKHRMLLDKSEFVEQEAQESDEDEIFGFGPRQKDNDDEEDGEYLDQTLEILVDDSEMDEKTVAANLVLEKFQEHGKDDDETLQKLHEAAIKGELRKKRKNRGFMNDSDDESDEDERDKQIRRQIHKKQRIDRASIKELSENVDTKSFFNVYQQNLVTDDADFAYLKEIQPLDFVMGNRTEDMDKEPDDDDDEPREVITTSEFTRLVRETAQKSQNEEEEGEPLDPNDVSWMDDNQSDQENHVRVKSVASNTKKYIPTRRKAPDQIEFDVESLALLPHKADMAERSVKWAKVEGRSSLSRTTGRNVDGAAVTGYKVKSGGGSLRKGFVGGSASTAPANSGSRRQIRAEDSVILRMAADGRTTRFS